MAKKLSAECQQRLTQALGTWQQWKKGPKQAPAIVKQLDGETNYSFLVSDSTKQWVVRLNNLTLDAGINRGNEKIAIEAANKAGIAPLPNFLSSDVLVTPYLTGPHPFLENLSSLGELFQSIHSLPIKLARLDLKLHLKNYYKQGIIEPLLEHCYRQIVESYPEEIVELKPCHNDCLLPNIIQTQSGLKVIDWEYAATADPAYDLAVFSATYNLGQRQLETFLSAYNPDQSLNSQDLLMRINYFENFYRLIEILWLNIRRRPFTAQLETLAKSLQISNQHN